LGPLQETAPGTQSILESISEHLADLKCLPRLQQRSAHYTPNFGCRARTAIINVVVG